MAAAGVGHKDDDPLGHGLKGKVIDHAIRLGSSVANKRSGRFLLRRREFCFDPFFQFRTRDEDTPPASIALEADIGAEPYHCPLITAAGVRLAELELIADGKFEDRRRP